MEITEILKDDYEYYNGLGRQYLSNSDIGVLLTNPMNYRKKRADSKELELGKYFHHAILEPHKASETLFCDTSTRTTKEYKSFCESKNRDYVLLKKEIEEIDQLVNTIKGNMTFFDLIYNECNEYEKPAVGELFGVMWKGKADIVGCDVVLDIKTTSDIQAFKYSAYKYNYDSQAYIYTTLFDCSSMVFLVADKVTGQLGIFEASANFINSGRAKVEKAVSVYNKYFGPNSEDNVINHFISDVL